MTVSTAYPTISQAPFFSLTLHPSASKIMLTMNSRTSIYYTSYLAATLPLLKKYLPSIFESKCFNESNLCFADEVKDTEIGHLFEHICLEYLCETKIHYGAYEAIHRGETRWDWHKTAVGEFNINIDVGHKDQYCFLDALQKSIALMTMIFEKSFLQTKSGHPNDEPLFI